MTHHSPGTSGRLQWETDVPVLTHPLVLAGIVKTFGLAGAALWMLLSFMFLLQGDLALIPQTGLFVAALACGVMVLGGLAAALVYRNRVHVRFTIGQKGARSEMLDKRVRRVNRLAMLLGLLTGKAGAVGAGLIGEANATTNVAWASVASVRAYPRWKAIALRNNWRTTLILFCTPETYEAALARVKRERSLRPSTARRNPVAGLLLHTVLIVVAVVPLFKTPVATEQFPPFFTLCFALAALWLIPVLAWATLLGVACTLGTILFATLAPFESIYSHDRKAAYEAFSGDDVALLTLAGLGAAYLVWLSVALLRGRIRSALAGDLMEMEDA